MNFMRAIGHVRMRAIQAFERLGGYRLSAQPLQPLWSNGCVLLRRSLLFRLVRGWQDPMKRRTTVLPVLNEAEPRKP